MSYFTHPQVFLYEFLSSVEHKIHLFLRMLVTKHLTVATDLHSIDKSKSMDAINYLDTNVIQKSYFWFNRGDQHKQVQNKWMVGNDDRIFIVG